MQFSANTKADVYDTLRKGLVSAMENGVTYVISLGELPLSFSKEPKDEAAEKYRYYDKTTFDTERIFDFNEWRNYDNYSVLVEEDEKKMEYIMQPTF